MNALSALATAIFTAAVFALAASAEAQSCPPGSTWNPQYRVCVAEAVPAAPAPARAAAPATAPAPAPTVENMGWVRPPPSQPTYAVSDSYGYGDDESESAVGSFHVNVLGLLGFGITPSLELGGRHFSIVARARFMQAGLMNYVLFPDAEDGESLGFGLGLSTSLRFYTAGRGHMTGFYAGALVEYSFLSVDDPEDGKTEQYEMLAFAGDIGYRWRFGSFLFGLGGWLGYAGFITSEDQYYSGEVSDRGSEGTVFAALNLDLGFYF